MSLRQVWVGIDVSARWFDAFALSGEAPRQARFNNDEGGFGSLLGWLGEGPCQLVLEGTGGYERALCEALASRGVPFSRVDPLLARRFAQGLGLLHKTDRLDARALAQYGRLKGPEPTELEPAARRELRQLVRALEDLRGQLRQTRCRLASPSMPAGARGAFEAVERQLLASIAELEGRVGAAVDGDAALKEGVRLLQTIRGVGRASALKILAYLPEGELRSARGLAAYAGLAPSRRESGSSVRGRPGVSQRCSHELRAALWMCGMVARRFCPHLRRFALALVERGKARKQAIVAVMRKLAHAIFAVLTKRTPYDGALLVRKA